MSLENLIENYINGNLTTAKKAAVRRTEIAIYEYLRDECGRTEAEARAIAAFLKGRGAFQLACDAEAAAKDVKR